MTQRRLRQEYPGVPPWEWEAHEDWLDRVIAVLNAEDDAFAALHPGKP
jgi:hypothetical protein